MKVKNRQRSLLKKIEEENQRLNMMTHFACVGLVKHLCKITADNIKKTLSMVFLRYILHFKVFFAEEADTLTLCVLYINKETVSKLAFNDDLRRQHPNSTLI